MKINNYYIHRINDLDSLEKVSGQYGLEVDLRYKDKEIISIYSLGLKTNALIKALSIFSMIIILILLKNDFHYIKN